MASRQDASTGQMVITDEPSIDPNFLYVKVHSPFHTYFDGQADSISAENDTGPFDVLLGHKNFLTLLRACDVVVRKSGQDDEKIPIVRGLMHVHKNKVVIFLDV